MSNIKDTDTAKATNLISAISQKIITWQKLSSTESGMVVNPTWLEARTLYGLAPDYARVLLDTHFKDEDQGEMLDKEIRKIARKGLDSKLQIRIKKGVYRPPHVEREVNRGFFEGVQKMAARLETKVASIYRTASSAVSYVPGNVPVLEGLGPAGGDSRSPNEYILRDSLIDRATLLALIIRESLKD
jgi:D-alanine-D-alanine ligase